MKARIQSVAQLKKMATKQLEDEFNSRYQCATLEGAIQGIALVMYALEQRQGWKKQRQQKLFDDLKVMLSMPSSAPWIQPYQAVELVKHAEEEFGIDFDELLKQFEALPPDV